MKEFANISKDIKSGATEIQTANVVGTVDSTGRLLRRIQVRPRTKESYPYKYSESEPHGFHGTIHVARIDPESVQACDAHFQQYK